MDVTIKNSPCKECTDGTEALLQKEVEHLREHLAERDTHFVALEAEFFKCTSRANDLEDQVSTWREKYERLYDSHKRVQKLNQVLEDKLLQMVQKMKSEKGQLTKDIATLSVRLAESKHNYSMLQKENERYKNDMNLAIQLLQCKPDNFVSHKLDNLPVDTQARVSQYVMSKTPKPAPSRNGTDGDTFDAGEYEFNISASLVSKILEDSARDTVTKHCDTCTCAGARAEPFRYDETRYTVATQTAPAPAPAPDACPRCAAAPPSAPAAAPPAASSPPPRPAADAASRTSSRAAPLPAPPEPDLGGEARAEIPRAAADGFELHGNGVGAEPAVHHELCDRTRTSSGSKRSSVRSAAARPAAGDARSTGAGSRTSSAAKSAAGALVGPGPRFCHLRVQAGSKNILLDNAEPDVPPVLYRRQSRCNESAIFRDLHDGADETAGPASAVAESTLVDVRVECERGAGLNPALLNVSSSPLRPLRTHNFSADSERDGTAAPAPAPAPPSDRGRVEIFNFDRYVRGAAPESSEPARERPAARRAARGASADERSASSLSSDDSAAQLQKQQLLRVAEWVQKNLEQRCDLTDPLEDERPPARALRLADTLHELARSVPHPVSKYARPPRAKETTFPAEGGRDAVTAGGRARAADVTADDLARMEYNVKKFLLSGPRWGGAGRPQPGSKAETDV